MSYSRAHARSSAMSERTLNIKDLVNVITLLESHDYSKASYYQLGLRLLLSDNTLRKIELQHRGEVDRCFSECLSSWLRKADSVENPSIDTLITALRGIGENAVADGINRESLGRPTATPTLKVNKVHPQQPLCDLPVASSTKSGAVHGITDVDQKAMKTLKQVLRDAKLGCSKSVDIQIIILGKIGDGKSGLINSIIDLNKEMAEEGADMKQGTKTVQSYRYFHVIPGVNVTVIDTPGLQGIHQQEQSYIQQMKSKCQEVTLILYCMKMTDRRLTNDDKVAMKKLHQAIGPQFWERVVFVLTFANEELEKCNMRDTRDEPEPDPEPPYDDEEAWAMIIKKRFTNRIKHRSKAINAFLKDTFHINDVPFLVAGTYKPNRVNRRPMVLPDRENWLVNFLSLCCHEIKDKHKFTKLSLNDKIHFGIVIDNYCKVKEDTEEQGNILRDAFECIGFCTLCFDNLNLESILFLLEVFQHVDHSQLASFALVFLSKGNTNHLYDVNNKVIMFEQIFAFFKGIGACQIPKLFLFHLTYDGKPPSDQLAFPNPPNNSIALVVSIKQSKSTKVSPVKFIANNLLPDKPLKQCFEEMKHQIEQLDAATCIYKNKLQDNFVMPTCPDSAKAHQLLEKKHRLCYVMLYSIRCKTIEVLLENKNEVMKIERISKLGAAAAGIVGGAMMSVSLSLAIAVGLIGIISVRTNLVSYIASKITSTCLDEAQFFVTFDRQFSSQLNTTTDETFKTEKFYCGLQKLASDVGATQIVVEEGDELAVRQVDGRILAVTIPSNISALIYNFYLLHNAYQDGTGQTDSTSTIQKLIEQYRNSLKGFCYVIQTVEHRESGEIINRECGYKVMIPRFAPQEKCQVTVSTILSGPFNLPEGAVLVSAVYDILIDESLKDPVTIDIEHCVDVFDESVIGKMSFAVVKADLTTKVFQVQCITGGTFNRDNAYGLITVNKSCLLCVVTTESLDLRELKYSINCSYTKLYQNFWTMKASFIKHLSAYLKYIQIQNASADDVHSFHFNSLDEPCISVQDFKTMASNDWTLSPYNIPNEPIFKKSLDGIGLIHSGTTLKETIPFIEFHITRRKESKTECDLELKLAGTDLNLPINCCD